MAKSKKERKHALRERQERLREARERIKGKLVMEMQGAAEEVEYVLPEDEGETQDIRPQTLAEPATKEGGSHQSDDEDRVELPAVHMPETNKRSQHGAGRKHHRVSWETLKMMVASNYGASAMELVDEHDGNAEDPLFTVTMKLQWRTVPVPRHWDKLRPFLSNQADREAAVGVVPPEIQALGVDKIRAARDKKANPNQIAFITCFMTGTPLQRKTFHTSTSPFGDVYYEGKWMPKSCYEPGKLSQRLRQALGMTPNAPPPWLYGMQAMRRLPPAYPNLRIPGLNAPIPPGAQWGRGQGQWGEPPRGDNNAFLFPGVMDEAAAEVGHGSAYWGVVPSLSTGGATLTDGGSAAPKPQHVPAPSASVPVPATPQVTITPVPFQPKTYASTVAPLNAAGPERYTHAGPQEYVRVQDSGSGTTVAVGHVLMPKTSATPSRVPPVPPAPTNPQRMPPPPQDPANHRVDRYTFQYAELKHGGAAASAVAKVSADFIHSYRTSPHYEKVLTSIIHRLIEAEGEISEGALRKLEEALIAQQNALLQEERDNDKERVKKGNQLFKVYVSPQESEDDEGGDNESPEARAAREAAEAEEALRLQELQRREDERYAALQRLKEENEERLRAKARKIDSKALEEKLKSEGVVLLNSSLPVAKGNKGGKQQQFTQADLTALQEDVAKMIKEKDRLQNVVRITDDELPAMLVEAKKQLAEVQLLEQGTGAAAPAPVAPASIKGQVSLLQQKLSKLTVDRNRLALQIKAMESNSLRDELLEVLLKRDLLQIALDRGTAN